MRFLLTAALLILLTPTTALADPMVEQTVRIGEAFWQARSVQPCAHPQVLTVRTPGPFADGAAQGCTIWIRAGLVRAARREHYDPHAGGQSQRELLCSTMIHELGHTAGLGHGGHGIMAADGYVTPWPCVLWRRSLDRVDQHRRAGWHVWSGWRRSLG